MSGFSPKNAARVIRYGRELVKLGLLNVYDYKVLDTMMWQLRKLGESALDPSYDVIVRESGVKRNAVVAAVKKLVAFGLITKTRRWVFVAWGRRRKGGGRENLDARQTTNLYVFTSFPLESPLPTASTEMDILIARVERQAAAKQAKEPLERALASLAARCGFAMPA